MQFINFVLLQIDDACRHIADGRIAQLRIALLLLDNAGEIQMERCASNHLLRELHQERMKELALLYTSERKSKYSQELAEWQPLTYNEKFNISRNFDEKVKYLSERAGQLDSRLAGPLVYLHRYRNEAYHCATIRKETIDTAARLLVEINCILLQSLSRGFTSYGSNDDYSWLKERFGEPPVDLFYNPDNLIAKAVKEFRSVINHNDDTVKEVLFNHFLSRIEEIHDALKFIVDNTRCPDTETAIRDSFQLHMDICKKEGRSTKSLAKFADRHSIKFLSSMQKKLNSIKTAGDRLESFHIFSTLESEFEPVEQSVSELAAKVDEMIQMEIDSARGK
jgi:hypothetical protein